MRSENRRTLGDFFLILVKWRKLILLNFVGVCLVTAIVSLLLPRWYKVTCSVLPPEEEGISLGSLSSLTSLLPGGGGGMELPLLATPSDVFASILQSRNVQETIIRKNDLMKILGIDTIDETLEVLPDLVEIVVGDEGIIYISVETKDPQLSLDMARDYLEELDRVNRQKRKTKARETRKFIENRLVQNKVDLANAENELKEFQENNRLVSVEEQTRTTLSIAAELMAELQVKRVELGVLQSTLNTSHQQVQIVNTNIQELEKQLQKLGLGDEVQVSGNGRVNGFATPNIPLQKIPGLALKYFRLLREVKIQETIFELIMQQYEQAKIQEKRNTPTIQVLDKPVLPEIKSRPHRSLMVMIAGLMVLVLSIALVFSIEYFQHLRQENPGDFEKYEKSYEMLKNDFERIFRRQKE